MSENRHKSHETVETDNPAEEPQPAPSLFMSIYNLIFGLAMCGFGVFMVCLPLVDDEPIRAAVEAVFGVLALSYGSMCVVAGFQEFRDYLRCPKTTPADRRPKRRGRKIDYLGLSILLLFVAFFISSVFAGGLAIGGKIEDGRYYFGIRSRHTEVTQVTFLVSAGLTLAFSIYAGVMCLVVRDESPQREQRQWPRVLARLLIVVLSLLVAAKSILTIVAALT